MARGFIPTEFNHAPSTNAGGAASSNSRPQPGAKTFGGLEGGGGVGGPAGQPPGCLERGQWVPQHTYLKMIPMTR